MSVNILNNLNLNFNEIQNVILQNSGASEGDITAGLAAGRIYYNTSSKAIKYIKSTATSEGVVSATWRTVAALEDLNYTGTGESKKYVSAVNQTNGVVSRTLTTFVTPTVTWAAGTTAGPTLKVTTDGGDSTAVAIPSASATASGVITTGAQTIAGVKTFASDIILSAGKKFYFGSTSGAYFEYDSTNQAIHFSCNIYSDGAVSAGGKSSGGGGGGGTAYNRLDKWSDYTSAKSGYVLSALLGVDLNTRVTTLEGRTIAGCSLSADISKEDLLAGLGLTYSLNFIGVTSTSLSDGGEYATITINGASYTPKQGDVVLSTTSAGGKEFLFVKGVTDTSKFRAILMSYESKVGTVTSVGISLPTTVFSNGSAVTSSGNLTADFVTQKKNTVFAGPTTGNDAKPTFRALVNDDIPSALTSKTYNGYTLGAACAKGVATTVTSGGTDLVTSGAVYSFIGSSIVKEYTGITNAKLSATDHSYTTPYDFTTNKLVAMLYDTSSSKNIMVVTDTEIVASGSKYGIKITFAQTIEATYRLVVIGI